MYNVVTDYQTAGLNPLAFTRSYNSLAGPDANATTLGINWRSNFDRYVRVYSPSAIVAARGDGRQVGFGLAGSTWAPDSDVSLRLVNNTSTITLTDENDAQELYNVDATGKGTLQSITQRDGYTQTLTYSNGQLSSVTDSYNRTLSFAYSGSLLQSVTTPDGLVLSYGYTTTASGSQLTSVSYNTSPATSQTYLYENASFPFALTGITDEDGNRFATWTYDTSGRTISSAQGGSLNANLTQISYDDTTGNRTVTQPLGEQDTYKFTMLQGVPKVSEIDRAASTGSGGTLAAATRTFTYDANGYMNGATDWNGTATTYQNNPLGLPTQIIEAYSTPVQRETDIVYDSTWARLPHTITTLGLTTTLARDGNGNVLTKTDTDTTTTTAPYATNGQTRTTTYAWTATGQPTTVQLPRQAVAANTTLGYSGGTLTSVARATGAGASLKTTIPTATAGGRPLTMTDPNGVTTTMTWSPRQRLLSSAMPVGGAARTTTYTYDAAGQLTNTALPDAITIANAYDAAHRLTTVTWPLSETVAYTRDAAGDVTGTAIKTGTHSYYSHTAAFDAAGRLATDTDAYSNATQYARDGNGNATGVTDPRGHATATVFDALNRPTQITNRDGGVATLTYDAHDRPLTVTAPNGAVTSYVYDGFGDAIEEISADRGTTVSHYDADGNVTSRTDALGTVTNYTYDDADRPLTVGYPADTAENVTYAYDQSGHGFGAARLTTMTDAAGSFSRSYDERGDVTSEARTRGTLTRTTGYTYDAAGLLATIAYPSGLTVTQTRDAAGQVHILQARAAGGAQQTVVTGITHTLFGPSANATYGNGLAETRQVDLDYRPAQAYVGQIVSKAATFDANGNPTGITDGITPANGETLTYDAMDRMLTASGDYGAESFAYDLNGNRTSTGGGNGFTYTPNTNRIATIHGSGVTTNAAGAITHLPALGGSAAASFTYLKSGRLQGTTGLTYVYDGFGRRVNETDSAQRFLQYGQVGNGAGNNQDGHLLEETDNQGNVQADYIYLDDRPVALYVPNGSTGTVTYLHGDTLGTPILATDANKNTVWDMTKTDPFGSPNMPAAGNTVAPVSRLPGQEAEPGLAGIFALNHNGARDYRPKFIAGKFSFV